MKLRVKFTKHGAMRFIGHLDLMRFFQKTIRRANIDIAYSSGFSPHQIMSFASPLGVGLTSNGEYMDIQVNSLTSCADVMERINKASIPEIQVKSVKILPEDTENAMASVAAALYTITFKEGKAPQVDFERLISTFLSKPQIPYTKETKKGSRVIDLKPGIFEFSCQNSEFRLLVDASSAGNIKPQFVMGELLKEAGLTLPENALRIVREEVYTNKGSTDDLQLIPLEELGYE